jgi:hypothetical protein
MAGAEPSGEPARRCPVLRMRSRVLAPRLRGSRSPGPVRPAHAATWRAQRSDGDGQRLHSPKQRVALPMRYFARPGCPLRRVMHVADTPACVTNVARERAAPWLMVHRLTEAWSTCGAATYVGWPYRCSCGARPETWTLQRVTAALLCMVIPSGTSISGFLITMVLHRPTLARPRVARMPLATSGPGARTITSWASGSRHAG